MTKTKKLTVAVALCAATVACSVTGGLLLRNTAYAAADESYQLVGEEADRIAYGAGWGAEASAKVQQAFKTKLNVTELPEIKVLKANSAGDALAFAVENDGSLYVYNALDGVVYEVKDRQTPYAEDFVFKAKNESRRIGAPTGEQTNTIKVTGWAGEGQEINISVGTTVQLFETGLLYDSGNAIEKREGVLEKISDTEYKMHPLVNDQDVFATGRGDRITVDGKQLGFVGDIDGTWHALRTARTSRNGDNKLVVRYNFRAGCCEFVYNDDWTISSRMAYAGQNFDKDGNRENLPVKTYTTDEHLWTGVSDDALNMYKGLSGNESATHNDLRDLFREGYLNLVENEGVIPGYRCSDIKTWSFIVCDYKYSPDSEYGFDGVGSAGRERMFTLVYSGVQNKVYGVGDDFWQAWKEDSIRPTLGAPISNVLYNHQISGVTYERIQIFENGYVHGKLNGSLVTETGVSTDKDYTEFQYAPAPSAPSEYGTRVGDVIEKTENGRTVYYYNYKKGAAKATQMAAKVGYLYDYYPGRNFVEKDGKISTKLLSYDELYDENTFKLQDNTFDKWDGENGVKNMVVAEVKKLLEKGFFPGFPDGGFRSWNNVFGTQFIYGDSTATPFGGDARTNVSAIMYNSELDKVFTVKDAFMDAWGGGGYQAHKFLGAPAGDEFTLAANPSVKFQYFYGSSTTNNKAFAVSTGYNAATWFTPKTEELATVNPEAYLASLEQLSKPLTSVKLELGDYDLTVDGYASLEWEIDGAWADATIKFTSSNDGIAEVTDDGYVEFKKKGEVTVTITVSDGVNVVTDSITFTVK